MAGYLRCDCTGNDVPHVGLAQHYPSFSKTPYGALKLHRRCTRPATDQVRRVVDTAGKAIAEPERVWYDYCAACADAIVQHQGAEVERRKR